MSEKILFKANIVYTKEKMLQYSKSKFIIDWAYSWYFIICLIGWLDLLSWEIVWWIILLIIGFSFMLIWYIRRPKIEAQNFANIMDEQLHTTEMNQEVSFTDSSIKVKNLTSWANGELFYNQIIRLINKKWFYGLFGQNYASMEQIYQTLSADDSKVAEWYSIPLEFLERYPDVVSLILNSVSLENSEEKQKWFDTYYIMNDNQINELKDILTREKEKLTEIEEKYNEEIFEINEDDSNQEDTWEML